jgi:hypothetical protein
MFTITRSRAIARYISDKYEGQGTALAEGSLDHTGRAAAEVIVFGNLRCSEECNDVIKCDLMMSLTSEECNEYATLKPKPGSYSSSSHMMFEERKNWVW